MTGIAYPISKDNCGYFSKTKTTLQQLIVDIRQFILTKPYQRPMTSSQVFLNIHKYFYKHNIQSNINKITQEIKTKVMLNFPTVQVTEVKVYQDQNTLDYTLYLVCDMQKLETFQVSVTIKGENGNE